MLFFAAEDRNKRALLAFLLGTLAIGALGSIFSEPAINGWYALLLKPDFTPPDWVFPWVWTMLYLLMGFAAWRVWRIAGIRSTALALYFTQLGLNLLWTVLFFGLHRIDFALSEIIVLLAAIAACAVQFRRVERLAGLLMIPYVVWTGFALVLNYEIWRLNS